MKCAGFRAWVHFEGSRFWPRLKCFWTWPLGHCYHRPARVVVYEDVTCCNCRAVRKNVRMPYLLKYPPPDTPIGG